MNGSKYYPFERNRYYYGKLLTTNDLEAEQKYINGKRRFINKVMFGFGRICGLNVYSVNEDTLMIESGFAIDNLGREIVVDQSEVKKISAIEGFGDIKSDKLMLTIEYNEFATQPVYSISSSQDGKEYEYNKIHEKYTLKIKDFEETEEIVLGDKLVYDREVYSDDNYKIFISLPRMASVDSHLKFVTRVEKISDVDLKLNLSFIVSISGFVSEDGEEKLIIDLKDINLEKGKKLEDEKWVKARNISAKEETTFMIKKEDMKISIGDNEHDIEDHILLPIEVSEDDVIGLIKTRVKNESLEDIMQKNVGADIVLAVIDVMNIGDSCVIKNVKVPLASKYSQQMPSQVPYFDKIKSYYDKDDEPIVQVTSAKEFHRENENADIDFRRRMNTVVSSGVFEMPLGLNVKVNKTIFSDEIMHNLGEGDVCVSVGFEFVVATDKKDNYEKKIVFGDPSVFEEQGIDLSDVSHAVQVFCNKGTFVVGLQFHKAVSLASVKVRWFAYRQIETDTGNSIDSKEVKGIYVKQDTVKLSPNDVHFVEVGFKNMNPTAVRYEVVDQNGGEINESGLYTAPGREGVFEIKISCINEPSIYTFAYVIVIKKDDKKDDDQQ